MWQRVPAPIRELLGQLQRSGFQAALVGGCVRDLARGLTVRDWDVTTEATAEQLIARFDRAVPIGLRHGTVMVPTAAGPADVTHWRGASLEADLARRDFTVNAAALRPGDARPYDPHGGLADLAEGVLRAVGNPVARLAEDPLRVLRAARFVAELELTADPALEAALGNAAKGLAAVAGERIGSELWRLLAGRRAGEALALLHRTGVEQALLPDARADAAAVVAALPRDPALRLAAWLRGTGAPPVLSRLRLSATRRREVERLLALHPVARRFAAHPAGARRLLRRAGAEGARKLLALGRAECAAAGHNGDEARALEALSLQLARVERAGPPALSRGDLALDGEAVMRILACRPGPEVGRALSYLTECVIEDPGCNSPDGLRSRLEDWRRRRGSPRAPGRR